VQRDLDLLGVAKNAREEKMRARDNARMAKLYREVVLKEPAGPELVAIQPAKPAVEEREEVGSFGD
jgi:7,8-dihydro-6-hydroxymethylpterin dimethyltransferase